ncbi:MAG: response regulator [Myxococcota bacterium]|nr:response regulator [Myxococcota bacterium]
MFDRLGLTTRMTLVLTPPFFVLAYVLFAGVSGNHPSVMGATGVSFLIAVALSGWMVRDIVDERRSAKRIVATLKAAQADLAEAQTQRARDRELQLGFEKMEKALIGGLAVDALAVAVIDGLCRYADAPVGALYLRESGDDSDLPRFVRAAGFALGDLEQGLSYALGEGLVGQVAQTGEAMEIKSPDEAPLTVDDGLRRRRAPQVLALWPIADKKEVLGVICLGLQEALQGGKRRFSERIMRSVAMAFQTALARRSAEATLSDFKQLASRLQEQQGELKRSNERLEEQAEALEWAHWEAEVRNKDLQKAEGEAARRAEDAARANEYKSEFLANMSHELRTPLNSIILLSKLLAEGRSGSLSTAQAKQASVIHGAGNDLLNLINDVLDLSKIEAGRMSIWVEKADLASILQSVEELFAPLAQDKGVLMSWRVDERLPREVVTDDDRVKQILRNFLSNAVKFVDKGEIEIYAEPVSEHHLEALRRDRALVTQVKKEISDYMVIAVRDTGIGIPEDRQQAIFEAFRQADGTTSRKYGGTGLGLNIVTKLAGLLGGAVGLWSAPGEGSTFFVLLPLESRAQASTETNNEIEVSSLRGLPEVEGAIEGDWGEPGTAMTRAGLQPEPSTACGFPELPEGWGSGKCLLLVDDDVRNTYALTIVLEAEGFTVVPAANGIAALEALDEHEGFDAVLMDIMMPEMDGYEATRRLRADGRFDELPVLALTARSSEEDRAACFEAGASDFLSKPIDHDLLMHRLSLAVQRLEA